MKLRFGLVALAIVVALAAPASAKPVYGDELELPVPVTLPMFPGQTAWLPLVWSADDTVDEVAITIEAPVGVDVGYPAERSFTSLYGSASLAKNTVDFSAFRLSLPHTATGSVQVEVHATWVRRGNNGNGGGNGAGTRGALDVTVTVPVLPYLGRDLASTPATVSIDDTEPAWAELGFTGAAPSLDDFRVTVAGPPGLVVGYPGGGTSTGLSRDTRLQWGASDHAAVFLDARAVAPGRYVLQVTATYATTVPKTQTLEVPLAVS